MKDLFLQIFTLFFPIALLILDAMNEYICFHFNFASVNWDLK